MKNISHKLYSLLFCLIFVLLGTQSVFASDIYIEKYSDKNDKGKYLLNLIINTKGKSINAIEGKLILPTDIIEILELRDGGTVINYWIEKPTINTISKDRNEIIFSGITPGGFIAEKGNVVSLVIKVASNRKGIIRPDQFKVIENNPNADLDKVNIIPLNLPILDTGKSIDISNIDINDKVPPEDFIPYISKNENGKNIVIFATQDKVSGLKKFEVKEGWSDYVEADSPYLLNSQFLYKKIYIKAIDNADNERVVEFYPNIFVRLYQQYGIIVIIILALIIFRKKWIKSIR